MARTRWLISLFVLGTAMQAASGAASLVPKDLRCEYQENPLAIQTDQPRFSWLLVAAPDAGRNLRQTAYRIVVASTADLLARGEGDVWDSGVVESPATIQIPYGGKALASFQRYYWTVRVWDQNREPSAWSAPANFRKGLLHAEDWTAHWIQAPGELQGVPLPMFRSELDLKKPAAEVMAYVSGLGEYELRVNDRTVAPAVPKPGWTNYRKRVFYNTYDLTSYLRAGRNAIGIMLGNGLYNVERTPGRYTKFTGSFGKPQMIFQARIVFADGTVESFGSDSSWRTHTGPITFSSAYGGEDYDARLEVEGWAKPRFDDRAWDRAVEVNGPGGRLVAEENPSIEISQSFTVQRVSEPFPGVRVYDLGQNFSGWPEITVEGAAGSAVKLIPGELLDNHGFVQQVGSGSPQWFTYTLRGGGKETWHPRFSYYGFRYVQVETKATLISINGQFLHARVSSAGTFECSNDLFDRIHHLITAAIESNTQSYLTDCPHREKLGWLEQTYLMGPSIMYNYNVARLYEKISDDMGDTQANNGMVPEIAPEYVVFPAPFRESPEWGSAIVLDPWLTFQHYGSVRDLAEHYDEMKRYVAYLATRATDHIVSFGLGDWYDIGPGEPGESKLTSPGGTATAVYYSDLVTLRKAAALLHKRDDATQFVTQAEDVRRAFNAKFYHPDTHEYDRGSQTANAMPLAVGIVPESDRAAVLENLVKDIRAHQNHVTAGDIGFHYVVEALMQGRRSDVLYDMLMRKDAPSYGYQLAKGATTLTEAWDANPKHSQNHFMLGDAEEWFYRGLAGIDVDLSRAEGQKIIIRPTPVGDVTNAKATYKSAIGTIVSEWNLDEKQFSLDVSVPPNAQATVYMPTGEHSVVKVGSGEYHFSAAR